MSPGRLTEERDVTIKRKCDHRCNHPAEWRFALFRNSSVVMKRIMQSLEGNIQEYRYMPEESIKFGKMILWNVADFFIRGSRLVIDPQGKGEGQKVKQSVNSFTVLYLLPDRMPSSLVIGKLDESGWLHSSA